MKILSSRFVARVREAAADRRRAPSRRELALVVGLAALGLATPILGADLRALQWLGAAAALAAVLYGSASTRDRQTAPPAALVVTAAAVLTIGATRTWALAPAALAGWTTASQLLDVRWSRILTAAAAFLGAAAVALAVGANGASDVLALAAYASACVACCTAVASRAT